MKSINEFRTFPRCPYRVDVGWTDLESHIKSQGTEIVALDLNPDFQRAHVWTERQQIEYCEYILKGGTSGKELYFNCVGWMSNWSGPYVIVDGKQRVEAVRRFMDNDIPVFGTYLADYKDTPDILTARFSWNIAALKSRADVLQWYLDFNSGGTIHTEEELAKVRAMLANPDGVST